MEDDPESTTSEFTLRVMAMAVVGTVIGLVPVVGALVLFGVGLAAIVDGRQNKAAADRVARHGPRLESNTPVVPGKTVTVVGKVTASADVKSVLHDEMVVLSVCTGYRMTDNIGNRQRVFVNALGGAFDLACDGFVTRVLPDGADLITSGPKSATSLNPWSDPRIATWFGAHGEPSHAGREVVENVLRPGDEVTVTGVVSSVDAPDVVLNGDQGQRMVVIARPGEGDLEMTNLSVAELRRKASIGRASVTSGVLFLVIAVASSVAWYIIARKNGWGR